MANVQNEMNTVGMVSGSLFGATAVGVLLQTMLLAAIGAAVGAVVGFFVTRWLKQYFGEGGKTVTKKEEENDNEGSD